MHYTNKSAAPFQKAIVESGATTARAVFLPTHPRHLVQFREFLVAAGVDGVPESEIFSALRKLPLSTVVRASRLIWNKNVPAVTWPFQPVSLFCSDRFCLCCKVTSEPEPRLLSSLQSEKQPWNPSILVPF